MVSSVTTFVPKSHLRHLQCLSVLTIVVLAFASVVWCDHWEVETVAEETSLAQLTDRSFRLDSNGLPRFVFGKTYAWFDGTSWFTERFEDTADRIFYTSLAVDDQNRPHISYQRWETEDLWYARKTALGWHCEPVDCTGDVGFHTSISLDKRGRPHISYRDLTDGSLNYAFKDANGWHIEVPDSTDRHWSGYYTSLELDTSGNPHIAYFREWCTSYAYKDSAGWHLETVDPTECLVGHASLSLDAADRPRMSYRLGAWQLNHAERIHGLWEVEAVAVDGTPVEGAENAIAVDSIGRSHICFRSNTGAEYVYQNGEEWIRETLEPNEGFHRYGFYPSVDIDEQNVPHMAYVGRPEFGEDHGAGALKYARYGSEGWEIEVVVLEGYAKDCAMAVDSWGMPHLLYTYRHLLLRMDVVYAYLTRGGWVYEVIGETTDPYPFAQDNDLSIEIDAQDGVHLCWEEDSALMYAHDDGSGWSIDSVTDEGWWDCDVATDADCAPHIGYVYHWYHTHHLRHAFRSPTGWEISIVDSNVYRGSLTLDDIGEPHSVYNSYPSLSMVCDLLYAFRDGGGWHHEFVDRGTAIGFGNFSPEVDGEGHLHVTYGEGSTVKYAQRSSTGWEFTEIGRANGLEAESSLELDHAGRPHIAYEGSDYVNDYLAYAYFDGAQWNAETVDDECDFVSLALDPTGHAHIGYIRAGDLRYARRSEVSAPGDVSGLPFPGTLQIVSVNPNPVDQGALIQFSICPTGVRGAQPITFRVFDCAGRLIARPMRKTVEAGMHRFWWKPLDMVGESLSSGCYFIRIETLDHSASDTRRAIVR